MNSNFITSGNSPFATTVKVALVIFGGEFLIMLVIEGFFKPRYGQQMPAVFWDFLDPVLLTIIVAPVLHFAMLRPMSKQQKQLQLQKEELGVTAVTFDAQEGVIVTDSSHKILKVNQSFTKVTGYTSAEVVGKTPAIISSGRQDKEFYRCMREVLAREQYWQGEIWNRRKNGEIYPEWLTITAVAGTQGQVFYVGIFSDITERKQAEELQIQLMHQLEEKERAKTRFLAAAGHDLRQPVTAASLFVSALKFTSPTPRQSELIRKLDESMKTFADLLEQLLDISKFDAGLIKPQLAPFNLVELFGWVEQNFAQSALDKKLRFRFYFPVHKQLVVRTDLGLLKSVLMNLVSNAIKFTAHGGILVSARIHDGKVKLQVWDTGIGIDEASCAHVFDEFYQVANSQRNREAGLGLGLSICKRTLSVLGSEVSCRSVAGRGSVFTFSLPLEGEHFGAARLPLGNTPAEINHELLLRDKRMVVVEDDDLVASGLVSLLRELGAVVRHFNNAEEALRQDDIASADYFIVDYALGGELTGVNFLVTVQQRQHKPIRAVVITGETSSQFIRSVVDSPWPVLHKPVNVTQLIRCLCSYGDSE